MSAYYASGYSGKRRYSYTGCNDCGGWRSATGSVPKNSLPGHKCTCKVKWVLLLKRTDDPKFTYIKKRLEAMGIPTKVGGGSFHASKTLDVPEKYESKAWKLLNEKVGRKTLDDIDDDDEMFYGSNPRRKNRYRVRKNSKRYGKRKIGSRRRKYGKRRR